VITPDALLERFHSVLSPRALELFAPLVHHGALSEDGDDVVCTFAVEPEDDGTAYDQLWILGVHARSTKDQRPSELSALLAACGGLEMGEVGNSDQLVLHDGFSGTLAVVGEDAWNSRFPLQYSPELCAPVDSGLQTFYVVEPSTGRLCFRDEGKLDLVRDTSDVVEVYLREVHLRLQHRVPMTTALAHVVDGMPERHKWLESFRSQDSPPDPIPLGLD
jgi:hypothetical protein